MATKKRAAKRAAKKEDVYLIPEDEEDESANEVLPTSIETQLVVDAIEFKQDADNPEAEPKYILGFHLELPEHIAQQLFAHHVQEGRVTVEFQPTNPELRRRGLLVRR
jgi:hypothetical protein